MEIKDILHKSPSKRWFRNGIHSSLRRADARGSADVLAHATYIASLLVRYSYWRHKYVTHRIFNTSR